MESLLLQDLITVRGTANVSVIQTSTSWLDLGDLEDVVIHTEVREVSGSTSIYYETAAVAQDSAFVPIYPFTQNAIALATGLRSDLFLASTAKVPPMRFLRWRLTSVNNWDATLRIWIAAYGWA